MVLDSVSQGEEVVSWSGNISVFHKSEMQMPIETFLDSGYIANLGDSSDGDLLF